VRGSGKCGQDSSLEMSVEKLTRFCCGQADLSMAELKSEVGWGIISSVGKKLWFLLGEM